MNKKGKGTGKIQNALISRGYNHLDPAGQGIMSSMRHCIPESLKLVKSKAKAIWD